MNDDSTEKRMAGDYEIIQAVHIGDREVVLGENPQDDTGMKYMCAFCRQNALFAEYSEVMASDDFPEIVELFGQRVAEQAQKTHIELNKPRIQGIDDRPITAEGCIPISYEDDLHGKIIVIKPEVLRREYRRATRQLKAKEGFCGMEVDGKHYAEKEDAGKAIIDVCTRMTGSDAVLLGQYRGFSMVLAYDGRSNEYRITLKGTLSHTVTLGADVFGNITRLDNALENLAGSLQAEQNSLEETKAQLENARTELATPFAREEELAEKTARLKELNILLNMDEKDKTLMDDGPDEGEEMPERKVVGLER